MASLSKLRLIIVLILRIGLWNFLYGLYYKITFRYGLRKKLFKQSKITTCSDHFLPCKEKINIPSRELASLIVEADEIVANKFIYFFDHTQLHEFSEVNWSLDVHSGYEYGTKHWIDSLKDVGAERDVKLAWENSRFHWLLVLTRAYRATMDEKYLSKLNELLHSWIMNNDCNVGINWSCGQEASYRLVSVIIASTLLESRELNDFIYKHVIRIYNNVSYAISQDNNHATSELIGLYIGATWLKENGSSAKEIEGIISFSQKMIKKLVMKLILNDGSFCMYSTNYHRVVMRFISILIWWKKRINLQFFDQNELERIGNMSKWLTSMIANEFGDVPNLGTNDGSYPFKMNSSEYRDYRGSIVLLNSLLERRSGFNELYVEDLTWFGLSIESEDRKEHQVVLTETHNASGVSIIKREHASLYFKFPNYKFRPSHDDIGHIDLWINGKNILCDSGSFSYNASSKLGHMLESSYGHNTVQIENTARMKRITRFLYLNWPTCTMNVNESKIEFVYDDLYFFKREVILGKNEIEVNDSIISDEICSINWISPIMDFQLDKNRVFNEEFNLNFYSENNFQIDLDNTKRSLFYNRADDAKRIMVKFQKSGKISLKTVMRW